MLLAALGAIRAGFSRIEPQDAGGTGSLRRQIRLYRLRNRSPRQTSMAEKTKRGESEPVTVVDEPGWAERFQRGLQRAPQHAAEAPDQDDAEARGGEA
jgi:hypothetical protein